MTDAGVSADRATVRPARSADAAAFAALSTQLGYPMSPEELGRRLERLLGRDDQVVLAACVGSAVVGWIHGAEQELLESERRCEILGLVVDETRRRAGIGRGLVAAVEAWARGRGLAQMSVRSNVARAESHSFYQGIGYQRTKTQQVYRKSLPSAPSSP
jgi:GNAT superfamily N-acetyltransferase